MFGIPAPTPFDLNFRLLGIPVRVSPWFWLLTFFLNPFRERPGMLPELLVCVICVFVSLLFHEFGHGLTARAFGASPEIALFGMGGLCSTAGARETFWRRLAVLAAGPSVNFAIAGLTTLWISRMSSAPPRLLGIALLYSQQINLLWGIFNLFPIWPLDGGRMLEVVLGRVSRRSGRRWTHVVGLVAAGSLAAWFVSRQEIFNALLCGMFAFTNYQMLQVLHESHRYGIYDSGDDESWKG